jgi:hypothetical protein
MQRYRKYALNCENEIGIFDMTGARDKRRVLGTIDHHEAFSEEKAV